ncbi:MAG: hypothetical protein AAGF15_10065, partial [Pseudomonadota bacterium]
MKKFLVILLLLVVVGVGGIGFYLYSQGADLVRQVAEKELPSVTGTSVGVGGVQFVPFSGQAGLKNFRIGNPKGYSDNDALSVKNMKVDLDLKSLQGDVMVIESIIIDNPTLLFEPQGRSNNLSQIQQNIEAFTGPADPNAETKPVIVKLFRMTGGQVKLIGGKLGLSDQALSLSPIEVRDIGLDENGIAPGKIGAVIADAVLPQVKQALLSGEGKRLAEQFLGRELSLDGVLGGGGVDGVKDKVREGLKGGFGKLLGKGKK